MWLGKLTALDMAHWVDWAVKPQHQKDTFLMSSDYVALNIFIQNVLIVILFLLENVGTYQMHYAVALLISTHNMEKQGNYLSGPSCSKLTMSLVNNSLKFTSSDTQIC